jgi:hypothetical protein|nr:MAG TPA: hypothetical protein [Caudoviricetes sp.]
MSYDLKCDIEFWANQENFHYPVYTREELKERIAFLDRQMEQNVCAYAYIKLAGRLFARFNKFYSLNDVNDFSGLYQAVYDEMWLHQKYIEALERALELYEKEIKT